MWIPLAKSFGTMVSQDQFSKLLRKVSIWFYKDYKVGSKHIYDWFDENNLVQSFMWILKTYDMLSMIRLVSKFSWRAPSHPPPQISYSDLN